MDCDRLWNFIIPLQKLNRFGLTKKIHNFIGTYCYETKGKKIDLKTRKYVDIITWKQDWLGKGCNVETI